MRCNGAMALVFSVSFDCNNNIPTRVILAIMKGFYILYNTHNFRGGIKNTDSFSRNRLKAQFQCVPQNSFFGPSWAWWTELNVMNRVELRLSVNIWEVGNMCNSMKVGNSWVERRKIETDWRSHCAFCVCVCVCVLKPLTSHNSSLVYTPPLSSLSLPPISLSSLSLSI